MRAGMTFRALLAIAVVAAAIACAHPPPGKPYSYVDQGVASMRAWLDHIPRCAPSQQKVDTTRLDKLGSDLDGGDAIVAVRGKLTLATLHPCSKVGCSGGCCNDCYPAWVVIPDGGDRRRELGIRKPGAVGSLSAVIRTCELGEIRQRLPPTEVIVSGFLDRDEMREIIEQASLCVVPPAAAGAAAP